jgi:signal peptidase II
LTDQRPLTRFLATLGTTLSHKGREEAEFASREEKTLHAGSMQRSRSYLFGPMSVLGLTAAAAACLADQALKLWLLFDFGLAQKGVVPLAPVLDLRLVWNTGISYGLLQQQTSLGGLILLLGKAVAVVLLWIWLARTRTRLAALSLGLIIGGAIGNAIDRLAYGAVADFVHFHVGSFSWYVFNLADAAIVAGVAGLLYESFFGDRAAKAP